MDNKRDIPLMLCDSHTHFDQYDESEIPQILDRAVQSGVNVIIAAGTTVESTKACISLSETYTMIFAGVGIHPMESHQFLDSHTSEELHNLAKSHPEVVCISEVGLDFLPSSCTEDAFPPIFIAFVTPSITSGHTGAVAL